MISPPVACRESTNHPIAREQIVDSRLFPRALLLPGHRPLFLSPRKKKLQGDRRKVFRGFSVGEEGEGSVVIKHGCVNRRSRKSRLRVKSSILEIRGSRWTENSFAKSGVGLSGSLLMTLMGSWGGEGDQETVLSKFWISTALLADEDMDAAVVRGKRVGGVSPPSPATLFKSVAGRMPG